MLEEERICKASYLAGWHAAKKQLIKVLEAEQRRLQETYPTMTQVHSTVGILLCIAGRIEEPK